MISFCSSSLLPWLLCPNWSFLTDSSSLCLHLFLSFNDSSFNFLLPSGGGRCLPRLRMLRHHHMSHSPSLFSLVQFCYRFCFTDCPKLTRGRIEFKQEQKQLLKDDFLGPFSSWSTLWSDTLGSQKSGGFKPATFCVKGLNPTTAAVS